MVICRLGGTFVSIISVFQLFLLPTPSHAEYDSDQGGWTEVIECPTSSWDVCPFNHPQFYWGGTGPNLSYTSPADWWAYASPGMSSTDCGSWINGGIVGGATYEQGEPSVPQGVDVTISTQWWDFETVDFSDPGQCGHQHAATYVWGWRYNGNSWDFEFVTAHQRSTYLEDGMCKLQAAGNPDFPPPFDGFAFGPEQLAITNSPYVVLYTKTQATSHYGAGCGQFECFHRVRVSATYSGGPGPNKPKLRLDLPTNDLKLQEREDEGIAPVLRTPKAVGVLSIGGDSTVADDSIGVLRQ